MKFSLFGNLKLSIRNKLFLGFGLVILVTALVSLNTYIKITETNKIQYHLSHLREPTVLAGQRLMTGMNQSLAGLRGYMILGEDAKKAAIFKKERARGWAEIDGAIAEFVEFSKHWTAPKNIERLEEMRKVIEEFRIAQQEVEDISHTKANIPSFTILLTEAAPRASKIMAALGLLINEEAKLPATPERKHLLKLLADSRGSFALGLANIRAYLLSGEMKFRDNFLKRWDINETRFKQISRRTTLFEGKQRQGWNDYKQYRAEFAPFPEKMFRSRAAADWNLANYWLGTKAAPRAQKIVAIISSMRESQNTLMEQELELLEHETSLMTLFLIFGSVVASIIGIGVAIFISRIITKPLYKVVERAKQIAEGNLTGKTIELTSNDELAELTTSINTMSSNLNDVLQQVNQATTELGTAANELTNMAEQTNQRMEGQQRETEQVATAMNEMNATVQEVAHSASEAATSAEQADSAAKQGQKVVSTTIDSINVLAQGITQAADAINKLGEDTNSVDNIVEVISGIAEQTNLLALNAAIEAARAGEQGRGFAVVADEVRSLAGRTQESTEEIRSMLERLKIGAKDAVQAMNEGHKQTQESVEQASNAGDSLTAITEAVQAISLMNTQIATASEEQSSVTEEMNRNVVNISAEAELALKNTQDTGVAAKQVSQLSSRLQEMVSQFKLSS